MRPPDFSSTCSAKKSAASPFGVPTEVTWAKRSSNFCWSPLRAGLHPLSSRRLIERPAMSGFHLGRLIDVIVSSSLVGQGRCRSGVCGRTSPPFRRLVIAVRRVRAESGSRSTVHEPRGLFTDFQYDREKNALFVEMWVQGRIRWQVGDWWRGSGWSNSGGGVRPQLASKASARAGGVSPYRSRRGRTPTGPSSTRPGGGSHS